MSLAAKIQSCLWKQGPLLFALWLSFTTIFLQRASAQQAPPGYDSEQQGAKVKGHLALDMSNFQDAILRDKNGRHYLYIQNGPSGEVAVVDVTSRGKPKITSSITLPKGARLNQAVFEGDVAILPGSARISPKTPKSPPADVTIWDFSSPGAPKVAQKFTGVKQILNGPGHVVYVLDSQGLWIMQVYDQGMRDWDYYVDHISP